MNEEYRFKLPFHENQKKIFEYSKAKVKIIAKGRRFGLTRGYAHFIIEKMLDGITPVLWVDALYSNIDRYVERYFVPALRQLSPRDWKWRQQKKELSIFDSKLDLRSADRPELIEGFAYKLIVLNEAGIILKDEYLWENAIRPMIMDYNPDQLIGGTPKGRNIFFDLKTKAQDDKDPRYKNWEYFHFTSYDNPLIHKEVIDELVEDMPEHVRDQEIFALFLEDSACVFRNIKNCIGSERAKPIPDRSYFIGIDLAKHVDFTVITVLDGDGNQVYFNRLNKLDWTYQKKLIVEIAESYAGYACMDATGIGDPIFDDLANEGLDIQGYKFTNASKKPLVESLMIAFEKEQIKILDEPVQLNELQIFGYEISPSGMLTYSAPEGKHDDCVYALALANWMKNQAGTPEIIVLG